MSAFTPSGMLFIPSLNGLSHNPEEYSRWEDVVKGANVLLHAILDLAAQS
jgi:acetylornithine deacetylase/succinyl-diaminopimelate desuccinylase-like protein